VITALSITIPRYLSYKIDDLKIFIEAFKTNILLNSTISGIYITITITKRK